MLVSKKRCCAIASGLLIASSIAVLSSCSAGKVAGREAGERIGKTLGRETAEQVARRVDDGAAKEAVEQVARETDDRAARDFAEQLVEEASEQATREARERIEVSAKDAADTKMQDIAQQVSEKVVAQTCDSNNVDALFSDVFDAAYSAALEKAQALEIQGFPMSQTEIQNAATNATNEILSVYCEYLINEWISR